MDNGDGTITDNLTQLVWEKKTSAIGSGANFSDRHDVDNSYDRSASSSNADGSAFTDFLSNLNSSGFAGQHDWRLPTIAELQTIVSTDAAPCTTAPCIVDPLFAATQSDAYSSSSTDQETPGAVWLVDFFDGQTDANGKGSDTFVRAVRAGS